MQSGSVSDQIPTYQKELEREKWGLFIVSDISVNGREGLKPAVQTMTDRNRAAGRGQGQDALKGPPLVTYCLLIGLTKQGFHHVSEFYQLETGFSR